MSFGGVEKLSSMFSIQFGNSTNFQRSIWSSTMAVVEFGMVLPHFVREPALGACVWLMLRGHAICAQA